MSGPWGTFIMAFSTFQPPWYVMYSLLLWVLSTQSLVDQADATWCVLYRMAIMAIWPMV